MAYETPFQHKPNSFSLFKNDKGDNEKRPDYTGEGMDNDGNMIKVSAWVRDGAKGKFFSCRIEPKANRGETPAKVEEDADSDLPF